MSERPLRLAVALNGYGIDHYALDGGHRDILPWEELRSLGQVAEELGFERIFLPEIAGREAFSTLAGLGAATQRIGLASGVIRLGSRDLYTIGLGASSLHEMTGGRFVLGLGSSEPIDRTRELVQELRDELMGGDWVVSPRSIPLYLGALGPRMVALAGEVAEGVILNWCTPERVDQARASIPARRGFTVSVYVRACLSHVDEHAVEVLKTAAAHYVSLQPYARQFEAMGLGKEAAAARDGLERGGSPVEVVPDRLVEATCAYGSRKAALARFEEYQGAGADLVVVYPVAAGEAVSSLTGTLMAAGPGRALER